MERGRDGGRGGSRDVEREGGKCMKEKGRMREERDG